MRKGLRIFLTLSVFIILGLSFISAGSFNNFWNKITGKAIVDTYCIESCSYLGYECGTGRICRNIVNCGSCAIGYDCLNGKCIPKNNTNYNCNDSDWGINYFIKGRLIDTANNADYEDYCFGEITLREYWCDSISYKYEDYNCSFGCVDGACAECIADSQCLNLTQRCISNKCIVPPTCNDSDGGLNYYIKGKVTYTHGGLSIILKDNSIFEDYCSGNSINEAFCFINSDEVIQFGWKSLGCKYGCANGACKKWYYPIFRAV